MSRLVGCGCRLECYEPRPCFAEERRMSVFTTEKIISLYLKVPHKPKTLLQRLETSRLEAHVEYKPLENDIDLNRVNVLSLTTAYDIEGSVELINDELLVQFAAKNPGLHTARIFANTKEVCHPMLFRVNKVGEVEKLDYSYEEIADSGLSTQNQSQAGTMRVPESEIQLPSNPLIHSLQRPVQKPPTLSPAIPENSAYPGDLFGHAKGCTFDELHLARRSGQTLPGIGNGKGYIPRDASSPTILSPETLHAIGKGAKISVAQSMGLKVKKRSKAFQ